MGRSARKARRRKKREGLKPGRAGEIQLGNPVADHFEAFIAGNATKCEAVVEGGVGAGKTVVICGAGPSLRDHLDRLEEGDEVWGINSAAPWLYENGHRVTHGFSIDQTPTMLKEWVEAYPLEYRIASTCHPHLVDHLTLHGRRVEFFHNYVGLKKPPVQFEDDEGNVRSEMYEDWLYMLLYDGTVRAGNGLNGVSRAIDVARFMAFDRITKGDPRKIAADCAMGADAVPEDMDRSGPEYIAWLEANTDFHVGGGSAVENGQSPLILQGEIDGRLWTTKPDLMITAVTLAKFLQGEVPNLEVVGDVLPNALRHKDQAFFDQLPKLTNGVGDEIRVEKG